MCNAKEENSIPKWITENISPAPPSKKELREARDELYKALSLFQTHVRWLIGIMFSMLTATIGAILSRYSPSLIPYLKIPAHVILVSTPFIAGLSVLILYQYYSVYVSALIFAVRQCHISRDKNKHPWLNRTIMQAKKWKKATTEEEFRRRRVLSWRDSFFLYSLIIISILLIVIVCLIDFIVEAYY